MSNVKSEKPSVYAESPKPTLSPGIGPTGKRLNYITWHQHHMYMARMLSEMSTESRPNGCYIVDQEHYQIASGFSGEIVFKEDSCQCAIVSALHKLVKKTNNSGENFVMYITSFPDCRQCLEKICSMKISKIWYWSPTSSVPDSEHAFYDFLSLSGIELAKYTPTRTISIDFQQ